MADQQPLNATFFAFKKRDRGGVLFGASVAFGVCAIALYGAFLAGFIALTGINPIEFQSIAAQSQTVPGTMPQTLGSPTTIGLLVLLYLVFIFAIFVLFAVYEAACLRWMIKGEVKGPFGFTLDADTWRVYGTYWAWLIFAVLGVIAMLIVFSVLGAVIGMVVGQEGLAVLAVLPVLVLLAPIYFGTRFAPAAATSVAEGRFKFFDAWTVSKNRFWALFGSFLLLWVIYFVVSFGLMAAWLGWMLGPRAQEIFSSVSDPTAFSLALNQAMLDGLSTPTGFAIYAAVQVVSWVAATVFYVACFGINARAAIAALEEGKIKPAAA